MAATAAVADGDGGDGGDGGGDVATACLVNDLALVDDDNGNDLFRF